MYVPIDRRDPPQNGLASPEAWLTTVESTGTVASGSGCADAIGVLRRALHADAVVLRTLDEEHRVWENYAEDSTAFNHRNVLRALELLPQSGAPASPLDLMEHGRGPAARLRAWGIRGVVVTDSWDESLRLEVYLARPVALQPHDETSFRIVVRDLAAVVGTERLNDRCRSIDAFVRRLTDAGPTMVHVYAPDRGSTVFANARCRRFFAPSDLEPHPRRPSAHNRHPWLQRVAVRDRARLREQLLRTEVLRDRAIENGSYRFWRDDEEIQLQLWSTRIPGRITGSHDEIVVTALDVTRERELEQHIERLEMTEQHDFGREIHDGVCQDLIGLQMSVDRLQRRKPASDEDYEAALGRIGESLGVCLRRARAIARGVHPVELQGHELGPALVNLVETTSERFGVHCRLVERGIFDTLEPQEALQFYWIARESVLNAARHAQADSIVVHLHGEAHAVRLRVADDGCGFDPRSEDGDGMGLKILEHRARVIGATLAVRSAPQAGTTVICEHRISGSEDDES
jgi:signal transduction histidine kinase